MILMNLNGREPLFTQIETQIIRFIELGVLKPGEKLPSVRMLAQDLGINPNTVARAYSELEEAGVIRTISKKGVYVADRQETDGRLFLHAEEVVKGLRKDGVKKEDLLQIIAEVYGEENAEN